MTNKITDLEGRLGAALKRADKPRGATPLPWRVGDAGCTVFGPPNGAPSPKTVARGLSREDAALVVQAANSRAALVQALRGIMAEGDYVAKNGSETARQGLPGIVYRKASEALRAAGEVL